MGREAVGPVCCLMYVKEPSAPTLKSRGSPRCSWFDWLHIAPLHLVNHQKVVCKEIGLILQNVALHTLQEKILSALTHSLLYYCVF